VAASDPVFASARVFVGRCQNLDLPAADGPDGGFFFSTTEFDTNKAGHDGRRFRSYGTTTADGILALLATGCLPGDRHIVAAQQWLTSHHAASDRAMDVPGFTGEAYQRWPHGLAFYYSSASAEVFRMLNLDAAGSMIESLKRSQRIDGSWSNRENLVKEDDPLIATPFAIRALAAVA
jgi:hypothetical protein